MIVCTTGVHAGSILWKVDPSGKKVFYNIPSRTPSFGDASSDAGIYYSQQASDYLDIIREVSARHGVDPELVKAVIQVESNYNHYAVSPKGARGLMQLMPDT